ncbi:hypothetical protein [Streptomyces sp. NPDC088748]|uniref:hypothetical protein n=1 Tax=Streptomyces sp. NPDC088748 TaxID=3365887 RepID=UPI00380B09C8
MPDPADLYRHAPDLLDEAAELLTISSRILVAAFGGDPVSEVYERAYYLRTAVQADRVALANPGDRTLETAAESARMLAAYDRIHPHLTPAGIGIAPPDRLAPAEEVRLYTRACYTIASLT